MSSLEIPEVKNVGDALHGQVKITKPMRDWFYKAKEILLRHGFMFPYRSPVEETELEYSYSYPLDSKLNELLKAKFSDIHAIAIDGESYSGVLLTENYQETKLPATIDNVTFIARVVLSRVAELYVFMDERLKV